MVGTRDEDTLDESKAEEIAATVCDSSSFSPPPPPPPPPSLPPSLPHSLSLSLSLSPSLSLERTALFVLFSYYLLHVQVIDDMDIPDGVEMTVQEDPVNHRKIQKAIDRVRTSSNSDAAVVVTVAVGVVGVGAVAIVGVGVVGVVVVGIHTLSLIIMPQLLVV